MAIAGTAVLITAGIIIEWDGFLYKKFSELGFIPSEDDINARREEVTAVPAGWTKNMNEDDVAKFQKDFVRRGVTEQVSPSVDAVVEELPGLPDL